MKIALLGGAGFIGIHVMRGCNEHGWEWRVFDKIAPLYDMEHQGQRGCDLTLANDWRHVVDWRPDVIINLVARLGARDTVIVVMRMVDVLQAGARDGWLPHVVHLSSAAVYGEQPSRIPLVEDATIWTWEGLSLYGFDKLIGETYLNWLASRAGIPVTILRPANIYGEGQSGNVVDLFAKRLRVGEVPIINGSAGVTRDFVHVSDVVAAISLAITQPPGYGQVRTYNVGTGVETSLGALADILRGLLGGPPFVVDVARDPGIRRSALDCSRIRADLGWEPKVSLAEGLAAMYGERS